MNIKDRIRKIRALSRDMETTESERETASRFLQVLEHNYPDLFNEVLDEDGYQTIERWVRWQKDYERFLAARVGGLSGVNAVIRKVGKRTEKFVYYNGPEPLVVLAVWTYEDLLKRLRDSIKGFGFGFAQGAVPIIDNRDEETAADAPKEKMQQRKLSYYAGQTLLQGEEAGANHRVDLPNQRLSGPKLGD